MASALRLRACLLVAVAIASGWTVGAAAQAFPNRQINLIVPYPPGGILDVVARILAEGMRAKFNQPVVVINRVGGGGSVGIGEVVRAAPDGYTLVLANDGSHAILPFVDSNFKFDPLRDFTPVAMPVEYAHALMVNAKTPVKSIGDFIAHIKARDGAASFGTPGYGALAHVAMEMFMRQTGTKMLHVPYRGGAAALNDLMIGEITATLQNMSGAIPQATNANLRILAVTGKEREPELPDVPTMAESGLKDFVVVSWLGILAPAATPLEIRQTLATAILGSVQSAEVLKTLRGLGLRPATLGVEAFDALYKAEIDRWKQLVVERGIKIPGQ